MPATRSERIRIVVVDDHPLLREGVVHALCRHSDIEVVGEGASADEAVALAHRELPDVMLIDVNMPGGGLSAIERIGAQCPAVACIVITVREDEETVGNALRLGARGYVLKGIAADDLVATVRAVHRGEVYITPALAARLLAHAGPSTGGAPTRSASLDVLSDREMQILRLVAKGMINKQIGAELKLSEKTIKHYVTNILQKLHVSNRVEAALLAQRRLDDRQP